jgi:predicted TIM-barrel fold metal-dependent hydrolase
MESGMDVAWTIYRKSENRSAQTPLSAGGAGPFSGGGAGLASASFFTAFPQLGHPMAPILARWLDNHMFAASVLIGFTVMQRFPGMKVVLAHGKASWMEEVLEKMEASSRVIPLLHTYPVRTDTEKMWDEGNVMLGFDAEERFIQKMPHDFAEKVVWGLRYPQHDTTSAHDAIALLAQVEVPEDIIAGMMGGNAARQFGVQLLEPVNR